jgi:hypothetical protein
MLIKTCNSEIPFLTLVHSFNIILRNIAGLWLGHREENSMAFIHSSYQMRTIMSFVRGSPAGA